MKINPIILLIVLALASSCGQPKLTKEFAAEQIIKQEYVPSKYYDLMIYCADPAFAAKVMNAGLEKDGLVIIQKTYKGSEIGKNLITFTPMSAPFKLATSPDLEKVGVQIVKVADFKFGGITAIKNQENGNPIEVSYDQVSHNVNNFSKLAPYDFKEVKHKTALFSYDKENGYRIIQARKR